MIGIMLGKETIQNLPCEELRFERLGDGVRVILRSENVSIKEDLNPATARMLAQDIIDMSFS